MHHRMPVDPTDREPTGQLGAHWVLTIQFDYSRPLLRRCSAPWPRRRPDKTEVYCLFSFFFFCQFPSANGQTSAKKHDRTNQHTHLCLLPDGQNPHHVGAITPCMLDVCRNNPKRGDWPKKWTKLLRDCPEPMALIVRPYVDQMPASFLARRLFLGMWMSMLNCRSSSSLSMLSASTWGCVAITS